MSIIHPFRPVVFVSRRGDDGLCLRASCPHCAEGAVTLYRLDDDAPPPSYFTGMPYEATAYRLSRRDSLICPACGGRWRLVSDPLWER